MTRLCPCGSPVTPRIGKGPPFRYCDEHAPSRRGYMTRYFRDRADERRACNRLRDGSRPLVSFDCAHCGQPTRAYTDPRLCHRCRGLVEAHRYTRQTDDRPR